MHSLATQALDRLHEVQRLTAAVGRLPSWLAILSPTLIGEWFLATRAFRQLNLAVTPNDFDDVAVALRYDRQAVAVGLRVKRLRKELHEVAESGEWN